MAKRKAHSYTVTDGDLVLELQPDDKGVFTVPCPFDPGLITEAKSLEEAFVMARDARKSLQQARKQRAANQLAHA